MKEEQIKININFKMIPFGYASIELKGCEEEKEINEKKLPVYIEPKTTNPELIEIIFRGEDYIVPKTTGGSI